MKNQLKDILSKKKTCYFISPHLDDAALSTGGLISYLSTRTKVVVITVFTEAENDKHSLSALAYVKKCGYGINQVDEFFEDRRREDKKAFKKLGVKEIHLGFKDALWRKKKTLNLFSRFGLIFLNEFRYIYPTHRLHVAKGVIHAEDHVNLEKLEGQLRKIVSKNNSMIFCPIGIGKHVDHIVTRQACSNVFTNIIYWSDYIYNLYHQPDQDFITRKNLKKYQFEENQVERENLILAYGTQTGKLYGGKDFNLPKEDYFFNPEISKD